jgi:hypothetical protein
MRAEVAIAAGERSQRDFDLTANIYTMQGFRATGELEGNAAAITGQRIAAVHRLVPIAL